MTPFADDCRFDVPAVSAPRPSPSPSPAVRCAECGDVVASPRAYCPPCAERIATGPSFRVEAEGEPHPYGNPRTYREARTLAETNAIDFGKRFVVRRFADARDKTGEIVFPAPEES